MVTLETIPLFRHLNRAELQTLRLIAQERRFAAGQEIFREGAPGDGVYFVKSGLVEISGGSGERRVFSRLGPGEFFGEIAALSRMARTSTIFADSDDAELLEIRWQGLRDLMKYDDALRTHINKIYRERALASYLRATPLFKNLSK